MREKRVVGDYYIREYVWEEVRDTAFVLVK